MIQDTVSKMESAIRKIHLLDSNKKAELLELLSALKSEISKLPETHAEQAVSIAGFAEAAAHEAARKNKAPNLLKHAVHGLSSSVEELEVSHPQLVEIVNEICLLLAGIGI